MKAEVRFLNKFYFCKNRIRDKMDILIKYSKDKLFLIKFKATIYKPNEVQSRLFLSLIKFKNRSMF